MMKKSNSLFVVLLVSVLGATIVSCSNSDYFGEPAADNQPGAAVDDEGISLANLQGEVGTGSRAAEQQIQFGYLQNGSRLGINMFRVDDGDVQYHNLCYDIGESGHLTYNQSASADDSGVSNPTIPNNTNLTFYAYAPYRDGFKDKGTYDFTVQSDQRTTDAYVESDLMWGRVDDVSNVDVNVHLDHRLTVLNINLTLDTGVAPRDVTGGLVTVEGTKPTVEFNISDGTISAAKGDAAPIKVFEIVKVGDEVTLSGSVVIAPQSIALGAEIARITWPSTGKYISFVLAREANFLGNMYYDISRTITQQSLSDLSGSVGNVKEWVTVEEETAEFERE